MHETVIIGEINAGEARKTRRELESLVNSTYATNFDIAELLHKVKSRSFYQPEFTTFQEYVTTLKIKPRKAQYLRNMAYVMEEVAVPRATYEPLGISRLRAITSLDPHGSWTNPVTQEVTPLKDFIVGFIEKGETIPIDALKQHVRTLKGFVGENDFEWFNTSVLRSAMRESVRPALELAKNHIGSVGKDDEGMSKDASDGTALEVIAVSFLNDPANHVLGGEIVDG